MTPTTDMLSTSLPDNTAAQTIAPAAHISELRRLYWSIRRELWENRSIYIAPLTVAALIVLGFLYAAFHFSIDMLAQRSNDPMQSNLQLIQPYNIAAALLMGTTFVVSIFYCLDALYGERRDRSILFWKSLPVSDLTTVISKASIPIVLLPLLTFVIIIVTQCLMLLINLAAFHAHGLDTAPLHANLPLLQMSVVLLYHLVAVHVLWYAPIYAWLLLVSAWARRTPLLWAILPPIALGVVELIALRSAHIFALLKYRLSGGPDSAAFTAANMTLDPLVHLNPARFFTAPGLWEGLALAAIFLAAAIQLRHYRNPI